MMNIASLVLDGLVAILLIATILFAIRLSARLSALRGDSGRLEKLISGLQVASARAEEAVSTLKSAAEDAGQRLQAAVDKAEVLKADIAFITERGNRAADRLEADLKVQRDLLVAAGAAQTQPGANVGNSNTAPAAAPATPRPIVPTPRTAQARASADVADKNSQSRLAALLKRASQAASQPAQELERSAEPEEGEAPRTAPTSRAERELLKALQARK
jgi:hypothetical protein